MSDRPHILVMWSDELIRRFENGHFLRAEDGARISMVLGEPDAQGYYAPTFTRHEDDWSRLVREAVEAADNGIGRDGCPFCGMLGAHGDDCIAVAFGAGT